MKIQGPNNSKLNPYIQQQQNHAKYKTTFNKQDQLEISVQAKKLQENGKAAHKREAYIQEIKQAIDTKEYQIDYEKTAQKMIDFWSKQ